MIAYAWLAWCSAAVAVLTARMRDRNGDKYAPVRECTRCHGLGTHARGRECILCNGAGYIARGDS